MITAMLALGLVGAGAGADEGWTPLFPADGVPAGWSVRAWDDVSKPAEPGSEWEVEGGVLRPSTRRGTWLIGPGTHGDFVLVFEIKLTELGNSGVALRAPDAGDPAFDGLELQVADLRYNPEAKDSELTGGLYRAVAPSSQVYRPTEWNRFRIELRGPRLEVTLNDTVIQDVDLEQFDQPIARHDGSLAPAIRDRPRRGRIGFQHLTRDGAPVLIRGARIRSLDPEP